MSAQTSSRTRFGSLVRGAVLLAALTLASALAACTPVGGDPSPRGTESAEGSAGTPTPDAGSTASPSPKPSVTSTAMPVTMPTDCRAILSDAVLAEIGETPLNPEGFGPTGVQPDGSLICIWRDPRADTTGLITTISEMSRGPALDKLNALVSGEGFTCYESEGGTRCEKEWPNPTYPVTDGRTLFWRDNVLINTLYSNFAPTGYTSSIVAHLFD